MSLETGLLIFKNTLITLFENVDESTTAEAKADEIADAIYAFVKEAEVSTIVVGTAGGYPIVGGQGIGELK